MQEGYTANIWRGELWIDESNQLYVEDNDGERTHVDAWLAEEMREEEPPVHREGEKYLGAGKVYVFVGRDDWEEFRNEVQEAESRLAEGDIEGGLDLIRNSLDMSKGLA